MREISQPAVNRLTKPWEEFVAYPYDDKVPKRRGPNGRFAYPEWTGGPLRGTLTIGYGHTDAAGPVLGYGRRIVPGMRLSESEGCELLANDMRPCCAAVERLITVPLTQPQFDTLADFVFNAGEGTLQKSTLRRELNAGNYAAVPEQLMRFTYSRGEHMEGLVHRRQAEISMWNMPDTAAPAAQEAVPVTPAEHGVDDPELMCPKAEIPPGRTALDSKSVAAGTATIAAAGGTLMDKVNQVAEPAREVKWNLQSLGVWDRAILFAQHHSLELALAAIAGLVGFMVWDRIRRLKAEHV